MSARLNPYKAAPELLPALMAVQEASNQSGLEPSLRELVATRASQLNRCGFCLDLHSKRALAAGEAPERFILLDAWRDAALYSPRERAALAWCEAVTLLAAAPVSEAVYQEARSAFTESELAKLTLALVAINGWNRVNAPFGVPPGSAG